MNSDSFRSKILLVFILISVLIKCCLAGENETCSIKAAHVNDTSSCPSWFQPSNTSDYTCECGKNVPETVHCDEKDNQSQISPFACVTYDYTKGEVFAGGCPYNGLSVNKLSLTNFVSLPKKLADLNKAICGEMNRTGLLCSQCDGDNFGPAVLSYSRECVKCIGVFRGLMIYLSLVILLSTFFCLILILLRFDITQASMNAFILFSQAVSSFVYIFPSFFIYPSRLEMFFISFYGLWNLDFFRALLPPFCISPKMNTLLVISLDYIVALYPLFFTAAVYQCIDLHDRGCKVLVLAWKPFHKLFVHFRRAWNLKGSVVNVFASLLLLSYVKLLTVSATLLLPVLLYNGCGQYIGTVVFFDASVDYLHMKHLPYFILATVVILVGVIFPLIFILCFPCKWFQKYLCYKRLRITLLCELAKVRHKSFKDGSNGTWDLRSFAAFYLIVRVCFFISALFTYGTILSIVVTGLSSVLIALLRPYKNNVFNVLDSLFFLMVTLLTMYGVIIYSGVYQNLPFTPIAVFSFLPFVYFVLLFILKIIKVTKVLDCCKCKAKESEETVPHRLLHSSDSEYRPLLLPVEQ